MNSTTLNTNEAGRGKMSIVIWVVVCCMILPILAGYFILPWVLPAGWVWEEIPFHSTVEVIGSCVAIFLAIVLMNQGEEREEITRNRFVASSFLAMGVLDIFHSIVHEGNIFVALHSAAVLWGAVLLLMVFLPKKIARHIAPWWPGFVFVAMIILAVCAITFQANLPSMAYGGGFSMAAKIINYTSGFVFLGMAFYFLLQYVRRNSKTDLFLGMLCGLFSSSGVLFENSEIWSGEWWLWHFIRLAAYIIVFYYIFIVYRNLNRQLSTTKKDLEVSLIKAEKDEIEMKERNAELEKTNRLMTGRELKMIELKKEIKRLKNENKK